MSSEIDKLGAALLSIGALSRATGVPADTLRTWQPARNTSSLNGAQLSRHA